MTGIIIKGIAGFYYVLSGNDIYECKARGRFRKNKCTPLVGDYVQMSEDTNSAASDPSMKPGIIDGILKRKNEFQRPPISNVDICMIVAAVKDPEPLSYIIDRMILTAELMNIQPFILINKSDLGPSDELFNIYSRLYPTFSISAQSGKGSEELKKSLQGKTAALCGPSGVGKSSIANMLIGSLCSGTGRISSKTLRGKNTTRHSEIFKGDGFLLFDTPGFTSFEAPLIDENKLDIYFPDFDGFRSGCRFDNCSHINEPDCCVKRAVQDKKISDSRYISYCQIYMELKERRQY